METPTLKVVEQHTDDVRATAARLHVAISGEKLFTGSAALEQAEQVRMVLAELLQCGISDECVGIESIRVNVDKGLFTSSSSATYLLAIDCEDLDVLPRIIDVFSNQKQCTLRWIEWQYDASDLKNDWLAKCIATCSKKAESMAGALGVTLGSVLEVEEQTLGEDDLTAPQQHDVYLGVAARYRGMRQSVDDELGGHDLAPSKKMGVRVRATYEIST